MSTSRCATAALLYALVIVYSSTFIGPMGPNFVPIDPYEALSRLLHIQYVQHGSDQRSDWMGNVALLVPLGFLTAGALSAEGRRLVTGGVAAMILCLGFILAVKYAQLFFPPRTVTLNYVAAQSLGTAIGIGLHGLARRWSAAHGGSLERIESLRALLRVYTVVLVLFFLTPLDFALNAEDLLAQWARFPDSLTTLGGEGRSLTVRLALGAASVAVMMPVGALLTLRTGAVVHVGRPVVVAVWHGFWMMLLVYGLTCLVISASASFPAVGIRAAGIGLGAWGMHWLSRQDPERVRRGLGRLVPWVLPIYLVALAAVNGLLSTHFISLEEALRELPPRNLYPLYNYYIVTKPQAAKSIAAHVAMYAPIGAMVWLKAREGGGRAAAFVLAALLSALVEGGRLLRPGLLPDINAIPLAGAVAWAAAAAMPVVWGMVGTIFGKPDAKLSGMVKIPRTPSNRGTRFDWTRRQRTQPFGDVEHY